MFAGKNSAKFGRLLANKLIDELREAYAKKWNLPMVEAKYHPMMASAILRESVPPSTLERLLQEPRTVFLSHQSPDCTWVKATGAATPMFLELHDNMEAEKTFQTALKLLSLVAPELGAEANFVIRKFFIFPESDLALQKFRSTEAEYNRAVGLDSSVAFGQFAAHQAVPHHIAASATDTFGAVYFGESYLANPVALARRLTHECGHHLFHVLSVSDPLFLCAPETEVYSSARRTKRPIRNALDALVAMERELFFCRKAFQLITTDAPLGTEGFHIELLRSHQENLFQLIHSIEVELKLSSDAISRVDLTPFGKDLVASIQGQVGVISC
jgi:hypothetical protein